VVIVRGVACRITWLTRKSSKKLPGLVFDIPDFTCTDVDRGTVITQCRDARKTPRCGCSGYFLISVAVRRGVFFTRP
jgi:hypothetical protein